MELAFAGDVSIPNAVSPPRNKRPREPEDDDSSPASTASSPPLSPTEGSSRSMSMASSRRVSLSTQSQARFRQPALFSLPMYSNELGRLPIYGQFNFSDSNAHLPPFLSSPSGLSTETTTNFDQIILSNLASVPAGGVPTNGMDAYVLDGLFSGQTMQSFANQIGQSQQQQQSAGAADFASFFAGSSSDFGGFGRFGTMPAMDNDTMTMWSTAPTGLECVILFLLIILVLMSRALQGWKTGTRIYRMSSKLHRLMDLDQLLRRSFLSFTYGSHTQPPGVFFCLSLFGAPLRGGWLNSMYNIYFCKS